MGEWAGHVEEEEGNKVNKPTTHPLVHRHGGGRPEVQQHEGREVGAVEATSLVQPTALVGAVGGDEDHAGHCGVL